MPAMSDPVSRETPGSNSSKHSQGSLLGYTVIALGLALFVRFFIAAPYVVSGASMDPNFDDWHYLIIDRLTYDIGGPQRGDVVVFDLPQEGGRSLIKRVIGLPGESVILQGSKVVVVNDEHPKGFTLAEPYLDPKNLGGETNMRVTLKENEFFVLGDNRRVSADSRVWGTLPREAIVGRAFIRLYPFDQLSILPGEARYEE
jgi:signal peptidase I